MKKTFLLMTRERIFSHGDTPASIMPGQAPDIKKGKKPPLGLNRGQAFLCVSAWPAAIVTLCEADLSRYKKILFFFLLVSLLPVSVLAASPTPKDFQYCAEVAGQVKTGALYSVHLTGDVLEKCSTGCGDLRLFGPAGQEVPFVVIEDVAPPEPQEKYPLEIADYAPSGTEAVITMKLPEQHRPVTVIEIQTPDRDFKKRVVLSTSRDNKTWRVAAGDAIYDFSSRVDLRKTRIEFKKTVDRYFRLKLTDDGGGKEQGGTSIKLKYEGLDFSVEGMQKKEIRIQGVHALTALYRERVPVYDTRVFSNVSAKADKDGNTVIILKTGLPVERLSFDIANPYYSRSVMVSVSAAEDEETYRFIARGTIYRFALDGRKEEQAFIDARSSKQASYKIAIENRGNPPLDVKAVDLSWVKQDLYFLALNDGDRHTLCFGNDTLTRPEYDIARFITRENLARHSPAALTSGELRVNSGYVPKAPKQKRARIEKLVLTAVVVVLVIGMGYWLFMLVRKIAREKRV